MNSSMGIEALKKLLRTPEDDADWFKNLLTAEQSNFPVLSSDITEDSCQYDPLASAKLVEKVLASDCVDAVYVPDMFLVNYLHKKYGDRVVYKPFDTDDRFAFSVKGDCPEAAK